MKAAIARIGQMLRDIQQRLFLIIERALARSASAHASSPRRSSAKSNPPATASVADVSTIVSTWLNKLVSQDRGNIDRRRLQMHAAGRAARSSTQTDVCGLSIQKRSRVRDTPALAGAEE